MDQRDNRYNNMGPRLDLGLRPPKPGQHPPAEQAPYRRQPAAPGPPEQPPLNPAAVLRGHSSRAADDPPYEHDADSAYNERYNGQSRYEQAPGSGEREDSYRLTRTDYEPAYNEYTYGEEMDDYSHNPASGKSKADTAKSGTGVVMRLLTVAALLLSIIALATSLFTGNMESANQATLAQDSELVPGATAERVAKLEKDMSSLLLKMVTLEKELEAIKNRNWSPSAITDLGGQITTLQNQLKALDSKVTALRSSVQSAQSAPAASPAARPASAAAPAAATPQAAATPPPTATTPPATSQVADRAGDKPDPLATRMDNRTSANTGSGQGQPRHTYTVLPGDTLFSVAQRYQVTTKDLMKWNNMSADDVLKVGKVLVIY